MSRRGDIGAGARLADSITNSLGSWPFVIAQTAILIMYILLNAWMLPKFTHPFDPYPFVFLNLMLSFQAAYTGPVVLLSQNMSARRDRKLLEAMYHLLEKAEQRDVNVRQLIEIVKHMLESQQHVLNGIAEDIDDMNEDGAESESNP